MKAAEVMKELEKMGSAQTRKIFLNHGCPEPFFGVKVADLKTIVKKVKTDTPLAKELYRTGNSDAMYLAGLIANGAEMSRSDLDAWAAKAPWHMISEYTVPWVAAEHPDGWKTALAWIDSPRDKISATGWATLSMIMSVREDAALDLKGIEKLLDRVVKTIAKSDNRVRYTMNGFIISAGSFVKSLTAKAIAAADKIGTVNVDMGGTACRVPAAADYIRKVLARTQGKKRASIKC